MSRSVLGAVRKGGYGFPECHGSAGQMLDTSPSSLTAKILCKRHNEALSPLDAEAADFFGVLRQAVTDLDRRTLSP